MKTITRSNIYLPMAAMILTAALAVPAAAQTPSTLQGYVPRRNDTVRRGPPHVLIRTTATGIGTHLGQFSFTQEVTVNLANLTDTGSAHWIAANGDSIYTTIVGSAELSDIPGGLS